MDAELSRAEADLQNEETSLQMELSRLAMVRVELSERMTTLAGAAQKAGETAIASRAQSVPPTIDADEALQHARAAREAALRSRREANTTVRAQLGVAKSQLQKLVAQVLADEKALATAQETKAAAAAPPAAVEKPSVPKAAVAKSNAPKAEVQSLSGRAANRVKMQAAVELNSDDNFFNGFSANISDGGLFVATVNLLPLGTEVDLSFSLPYGERIDAKGVVRWVREVNDKIPETFPGMGVQFVTLSQNAQMAIDHFLSQRDPLFFEAHEPSDGREGQVS